MSTVVLPSDELAEKAVLCALLLSPIEVGADCSLRLTQDSFFLASHRILYGLITERLGAGKPVDYVSLRHTLCARQELEEIGGEDTLSEIFGFVATSDSAQEHIGIVRELSQRRRAILACRKLERELMDENKDTEATLSAHCIAITDMLALATRGQRTFREKVLDAWDFLCQEPEKTSTLRFGIKALDEHLTGLDPGSFVLISAASSGGKSLLAAQATLHAALDGKSIALFSLEMSERELITRMLCHLANASMKRLLQKRLYKFESERLLKAVETLAPLSVALEDRFIRDAGSIVSRVRELHSKHKLGLVIVDYMQLVENAACGKNRTREQEISEAARRFLCLSNELSVPVLSMSQVNEADGSLRDCKAIAFHSDVWIHMDPGENGDNARILRVKKGRNVGRSGDIHVMCEGEYMRFTETEPRQKDSYQDAQ